MPVPSEISRERLLAYLLGELPAEELSALDEQVLKDEDFADALDAMRADCLDDYALGRGSREERERIARALNLAGSDDRSVALARAWHRALAPRDHRAAGRGRWAWALALAASVVLAIGIGWLMPWESTTVNPGTGGGHGFVLLLQPEVLRGATAPGPVVIPGTAPDLDVQIVVRRSAPRYTVRVLGPTGPSTYQGLAVRTAGKNRYVQFSIPRGRMATGTYRFEVLQRLGGRRVLEHRYVVTLAVR
jgi:hypothetical protein